MRGPSLPPIFICTGGGVLGRTKEGGSRFYSEGMLDLLKSEVEKK